MYYVYNICTMCTICTICINIKRRSSEIDSPSVVVIHIIMSLLSGVGCRILNKSIIIIYCQISWSAHIQESKKQKLIVYVLFSINCSISFN